MKHSLTLNSTGIMFTLDEQKTFFDQIVGRGRRGSEREYRLGNFDVLAHAVAAVGSSMDVETSAAMHDYVDAIEHSVEEGLLRMSGALLVSSGNTLDEVESVKIASPNVDANATEIECDVPSMHKIIITVLEGIKRQCAEHMVRKSPGADSSAECRQKSVCSCEKSCTDDNQNGCCMKPKQAKPSPKKRSGGSTRRGKNAVPKKGRSESGNSPKA